MLSYSFYPPIGVTYAVGARWELGGSARSSKEIRELTCERIVAARTIIFDRTGRNSGRHWAADRGRTIVDGLQYVELYGAGRALTKVSPKNGSIAIAHYSTVYSIQYSLLLLFLAFVAASSIRILTSISGRRPPSFHCVLLLPLYIILKQAKICKLAISTLKERVEN